MAIITNKEIALLGIGTTYQGQTAKLTKDILSNTGYAGYDTLDANMKAQFWNLLVQVYLDKIKGPDIKIPKSFEQIVDYGSNPYGGQARRIRTKLQKSTNPRGLNLTKGSSVDPWVYRPIETEEKFWRVNWEYANNSTIDNKQIKLAFNSEYGINEIIGQIMRNMDDAKALQEYTLVKYMFNTVINRLTLKDKQKVEVPEISAESTNAEMTAWLEVFQNFFSMMTASPYSAEFNEAEYEHGIDPSNYILFVRADIWNHLKTTIMATTYHIQNLGIPFQIVPTTNFGGITYTKTIEGVVTPMVPVYSTNAADVGTVLGYNADGDPEKTIYQPKDLDAVDNDATTDAVLIEKGALFIRDNSPYTVNAIYNPAGDYTNFWAMQHNRTIGYDDSYDIIKFYHTET